MSPDYLQNQLDQSLQNMNLAAVDVYYIHNPESQLSAIDRNTFDARISKAFEVLEKNRTAGKLQFYGVATWNGFRISPQDTNYHSLERFVNIAKQIGGADHGFKFIQLPFNLAMPEAFLLNNQAFEGKVLSTISAANDLGVSVMISGSILQGKLSANLPENIRSFFGNLETDAQTSLQFVRSTPNITTALVGMSKANHVEENMKLAQTAPMNEQNFQKLFTEGK